VMLATIATFMATQGLSMLLGFVATMFKNWMETKQAAASAKEAGAAEATAATNRETADAEHRASDVAINAKHGADLDDDLASGKRGI
jgi:hypothetical protein